jgi:diphthine synthase
MGVTFIGLGLTDEKGLSLEGLEEARRSDRVFAEFYTNMMPGLNRERLEALVGKKIMVLTRSQLEEEGGKQVIDPGEREKVAFLVPGDPMIATTHISIRLALARKHIPSWIIHGPSITSAVCGATGLQSYKFGKSVTMPQDNNVPRSVLDTIRDNSARGLHSLLLLDVRPEMPKQLTISEATARLIETGPSVAKWLGIGVARVGAKNQLVIAAKLGKLRSEDFGDTPHSLVIPGKLHFVEVESLRVFCGASDADLESLK